MFGSNKTKEEHETVKLHNEEVMVENKPWLMNWKDQCICEKTQKSYLYCSKASNTENVEIFYGLHNKVTLLMRRRSGR